MDNRMRVNKIQVIGVDITKDDLLEAVLEDVLQAKVSRIGPAAPRVCAHPG